MIVGSLQRHRAEQSEQLLGTRSLAARGLLQGFQVKRAGLAPGAGSVGFAAAAEGGMDGTGAEVAELGDCEQELGAALFQGGQGIGHEASFV